MPNVHKVLKRLALHREDNGGITSDETGNIDMGLSSPLYLQFFILSLVNPVI